LWAQKILYIIKALDYSGDTMKNIYVILLFSLLLVTACTPVDDVQEIEESYEEKVEDIIEAEEVIEETQEIFLESAEDAYARQVFVISETVESIAEDYEIENGCSIEADSTTYGEGYLTIEYNFDSEFSGEELYFACDQYERYGLSGDDMYPEFVPSSLSVTMNCDWGRVTTPTVYWLSASDGNGEDYCRKGVTVIPLEEDAGGCFDEETVQAMKDDCSTQGWEYYSLPDANNCETVYCGTYLGDNCPSEGRIEQVKQECIDDGYNTLSYTAEDGCSQVRCSSCPYEEDIEGESAECENLGASAVIEYDELTGCQWVYCTQEDTEVENPPVSDDLSEEPAS
jgi:hypothetical protein